MSNWQTIWRTAATYMSCFLLGAVFLQRVAFPQAISSQQDGLQRSLARLSAGTAEGADVELIARAGARQAIPALEEQFRRVTDLKTKGKIASGLVRLGDKDNTYFDYLSKQATLAVESDVPDAAFDSQGKRVEHQLPIELKAWALRHNMSANSAGQYALYDLPSSVLLLGETGDPRAVPLLRKALRSHNFLIVATAARGLAQIQDKDSIPLIIEACRRVPPLAAPTVARALVFFDDPRAQTAVDTYMPAESAKASRDARDRGMKPFGP
jgi:HEAT repeat protein